MRVSNCVAVSAVISLASLQAGEPPTARPARTDLRLVWTSSETNGTYVIAWGDYDGDGDPDLACGNKWRTAQNQLYRNDRGNLVLVWTAPIEDATESDGLAWGDFDGDGDIDLAVANAGPQPNRVWRNDGGKLVEAWVSAEHDWCFAVRWADLDGDGDLDLAVGSREQELSRVYRNNQGTLEPALSFAESSRSEGLDWADMDGDGDPDLALANYRQQPNLVFENRDGALVQVWSSPELDNSLSAAWGDWDGDKDLDLAIANEHEPNRVYENRDGELVLAWSSKEADASRSVAWGDWDGDGDLDLAVGNEGAPNRVYENTGGGLTLAWSSFEADHTVCVAWADVNGDGFLDLACGNKGPNRLYLNFAEGRVASLPKKQWRAANALEGVKWQGRYVNHLGAIKTCLDCLGVKISRGWLFGGTAHAFAINLRETVCVSSPTAWNTQMLFDLAPNLGYKVEGIKLPKANAGQAFPTKQREAWDLVRESIDSGFPCYGFELQHPDYYVVYGYEDGHYLFDGWAKGRLPWQKLGAYDLCVLEIYAVKPCKPAPADKVAKDALAAAIKHAENPGHWVLPRYQSGPTAFDLWADELESGRAIHDSHCYNAAFWHECREAAVEFLLEAKQRLPGRCDAALDEAIADYTIVRDNLKQLVELHPERKNRNWQDKLKSPEGAALLREAGAAECEGLSDLERILAAF